MYLVTRDWFYYLSHFGENKDKDIILYFVLTTWAVFLFVVIGKLIARVYLKISTKKMFEKNKPLSQMCEEKGNQLLAEFSTFRQDIDDLGLNQSYKCSNSIASNASANVIKYLMKYSNIENDEVCLEKVDFCRQWLNEFEDVREELLNLGKGIKKQSLIVFRPFVSKKKAGYIICHIPYKLSKTKYPCFEFMYVSPAGRSRRSTIIEINEEILLKIQSELYGKVGKKGHSKTQRSKMTNDLREAIKKRDNYTCCNCGISVLDEPNLLLEVDHIIPVSKGGKTEAANLQTLCWKCNRAKSDSIE